MQKVEEAVGNKIEDVSGQITVIKQEIKLMQSAQKNVRQSPANSVA